MQKQKEVSNLELAFGNFKLFLWKLLKELLKLVWDGIKILLTPVWNFMNKKWYVGKYPKVKKYLLISLFSVIYCYVIVATYLIINVKEVYIVEKVQAVEQSVGPVVSEQDTATHDAQDSENGEDEANLVSTSPAIEKIVDYIHLKESSRGKNNFSKCASQGLYNEYGYSIPGDGTGEYKCFEKGKDREAVVWQVEKDLKTYSVNQLLCRYNTGKATDSCPYVDNLLNS